MGFVVKDDSRVCTECNGVVIRSDWNRKKEKARKSID
jgi:hypothetical protein